MLSPLLTVPSLLLLLLPISPTASLTPSPTRLQPECATSFSKTPSASFNNNNPPSLPFSSPFAATLHSTLSAIQTLVSTISSFSRSSAFSGGDLRLSSAISDCLDLLDLSPRSSPLPRPGHGSGDRLSDLRSWLSADLGNQDTCLESLSGTSLSSPPRRLRPRLRLLPSSPEPYPRSPAG
ncbi:uncharacterized protein A4U43_C06F3270 [Asparagus officinalis]|uniref:Pectinesterase inhibitor domain-containing protein n=1 Tax=Asparagus officinalis TaxID=4686 RepID=A0A5P1EJ97_ASPOF|nr:uncharacterized protein A4U43_C06F3270 [Asparagus officinalis]